MGTFTRKLRILHANSPEKFDEMDALVDTGAFYSWIPHERLAALGYVSTGPRPFQIATGQVIERDLCEA